MQLHRAFINVMIYVQSLQAYATIIHYVEELSLSFATTLRSNEPSLNLEIKMLLECSFDSDREEQVSKGFLPPLCEKVYYSNQTKTLV